MIEIMQAVDIDGERTGQDALRIDRNAAHGVAPAEADSAQRLAGEKSRNEKCTKCSMQLTVIRHLRIPLSFR